MADKASMILFGGNQGHDSQIRQIAADIGAGNISIGLMVYPDGQDSAGRIAVKISFSDVKSFICSADLGMLADNASAGNVTYWQIAELGGTSHFYLCGGYIAITSRAAPQLNFI